jgi:hypothetical protein
VSELVDVLFPVLKQHQRTGGMLCECTCGFKATTKDPRTWIDQSTAHIAEVVAQAVSVATPAFDIAQELIDTVTAMGADATVAAVINTVSAHHLYDQGVVRATYWQLMADNRIARSADGHLSPVACDDQ